MPTNIAHPLQLSLTASYLIGLGYSPFVAGDDWELRFSVRNEDDDPVSLTGALIIFTARHAVGGDALLSRRSDTNIVGSSPSRLQIQIDADQSAENTANNTGKSWFTLRYGRESADRTETLAAIGKPGFDVRIVFGDDSVRTYSRGIIEVLQPYTDPAQ